MEIERINGIKLELGGLTAEELINLRGYVQERLTQAEADLEKVDLEFAGREVFLADAV